MSFVSSLAAFCLLFCVVMQSSSADQRQEERRQKPLRTNGFQEAKDLGASNLQFTNNLYRFVKEQQPGNIFFSPLSIHAILSMTSFGAKGTTLKEMTKGLSLPADVTKSQAGFKYLIENLNNMTDKGVTVKVANKIYAGRNFQLSSGYRRQARDVFSADAETIDFRAKSDATHTINSWIERNTNNKIKNMISEDQLSADTAMILLNAVYFKGTWKTKFVPDQTEKMKFFVTPQKPVEVSMMHAEGDFNFKQDEHLDAKILNLHYNNDLLSMLIVLPNKAGGLAELESKLTPTVLRDLPPHRKQRFNVDVLLPKFKLEESTQLNEILKKMGMQSMFSNSANLTGILERGEGLKVSDVAHKSFIEVNEEGTEAAAATVAQVQTLSLYSDETYQFHANQPFLFIVRHKHLHHVLFMGRYKAPSTLEH